MFNLTSNILLEARLKPNQVIAYHASDNRDLGDVIPFDDEHDSGLNMFGKGIYFASNPDSDLGKFGRYTNKYILTLNNPLNLNITLQPKEMQPLLLKFCKAEQPKQISLFQEKISLSKNQFTKPLQWGNFIFKAIDIYDSLYKQRNPQSSILDSDSYHVIQPFIKSLGYDSMYHYSNERTDFSTTPTDYGYCYIVFSSKQIKSVKE
jgi:hypothetical protein